MINGASKGRYFLWNKNNFGAPNVNSSNGYFNRFDGKLEFLRGYVAAVGASKGSGYWASLSDFNFFAANPRISRFFSSGAPKKKSKRPCVLFFNVILATSRQRLRIFAYVCRL